MSLYHKCDSNLITHWLVNSHGPWTRHIHFKISFVNMWQFFILLVYFKFSRTQDWSKKRPLNIYKGSSPHRWTSRDSVLTYDRCLCLYYLLPGHTEWNAFFFSFPLPLTKASTKLKRYSAWSWSETAYYWTFITFLWMVLQNLNCQDSF